MKTDNYNLPNTTPDQVPNKEEIEAYSTIQARGFIIGNLVLKFVTLGMSEDKAINLAGLIVHKATGGDE